MSVHERRRVQLGDGSRQMIVVCKQGLVRNLLGSWSQHVNIYTMEDDLWWSTWGMTKRVTWMSKGTIRRRWRRRNSFCLLNWFITSYYEQVSIIEASKPSLSTSILFNWKQFGIQNHCNNQLQDTIRNSQVQRMKNLTREANRVKWFRVHQCMKNEQGAEFAEGIRNIERRAVKK